MFTSGERDVYRSERWKKMRKNQPHERGDGGSEDKEQEQGNGYKVSNTIRNNNVMDISLFYSRQQTEEESNEHQEQRETNIKRKRNDHENMNNEESEGQILLLEVSQHPLTFLKNIDTTVPWLSIRSFSPLFVTFKPSC